MYESVKKILDKSKLMDCDVLVARDMCIAEDKLHESELREAGELIGKYYYAIAMCRRCNDEESIKRLCDLVANGEEDGIKALIDEIMKKEV